MRMKETRYSASGSVQVVRSSAYNAEGQALPRLPQTDAAPSPEAQDIINTRGKMLEHSKTHPRMLKSNATSHIWPFGALAELVDNAQDIEAAAHNVYIKGEDTITKGGSVAVVDDGLGMTRAQLQCMLGFGFSDKEHVEGNVGRFGIGFKSGSMRLGSDVMVITREEKTTSMALLSQTFLDDVKADDILIPMLTWRNSADGTFTPLEPANQQSWNWSRDYILQYSFVKSEKSMERVLSSRKGTGTAITIFNLKQPAEFVFQQADIQLRTDQFREEGSTARQTKFQQHRDGQQASLEVAEDYSLRAYLEVLYLKPRVNIFLQGSQIKFRDPLKVLQIQCKKYGPYTPKLPGVAGSITCWFGYNSNSGKLCGMHLYHKNRLIRMYERYGSQLQANCMMKDLLGVAVVDCITPTHNKQAFNTSEIVYSRFKQYLVKMMNTYYFEYQTHRDAGKGARLAKRAVVKRKANQISAASSDGEQSYEEGTASDVEDEEEAVARSRSRSRGRSQRNAGSSANPPADPSSNLAASSLIKMSNRPQWVTVCMEERAKLMKHRQAAPFKVPVDIELLGCHDYYAVIKEPMDLSTIKTNLDRNRYTSPLQFYKDVHLMLANAVQYNGESHFVGKYALNIKDFFNKSWEIAKTKFDPALLVEEQSDAEQGDVQTGQAASEEAQDGAVSGEEDAAMEVQEGGPEADGGERSDTTQVSQGQEEGEGRPDEGNVTPVANDNEAAAPQCQANGSPPRGEENERPQRTRGSADRNGEATHPHQSPPSCPESDDPTHPYSSTKSAPLGTDNEQANGIQKTGRDSGAASDPSVIPGAAGGNGAPGHDNGAEETADELEVKNIALAQENRMLSEKNAELKRQNEELQRQLREYQELQSRLK